MASAAMVVGCLVCGAAAAGERPEGERLVVFPLEGVNVPAGTARAATELLVSSLRGRGVDVADDLAAAPAVEAPPTPPPPAPASPTSVGPQLVEHATPPPAPGMTAFFAGADAQAAESAAPVLPVGKKAEIARGLGCTGWVDGQLVRLGSEIRATVALRDPAGREIDARSASIRSDDALAEAIDVIARALTGDPAAGAALKRNLAGAKPGAPAKRRFERSFGVALGGMFGVADTLDTGMMVGFDGRFEIGRFLAVANAGIVLASPDRYDDWADSEDDHYGDFDEDYVYYDETDDWSLSTGDEPGFQVWVNVDLAGYLLRSSVSPYLGAGVGAFIGGRVHVEERVDLDGDDANGADGTKFWDSAVGLDLHPTIGIEFLRHGPIRLHLEMRYTCNFSAGGSFGHGPVVLAGVNF